jgi:hypothetical protein
MPSPVIDYVTTAQGKTLDAISQSQAAVLDAVETWAKAVEGSVQDLPAIPVASSLPSIEELLELQFNFAGRVLAAQRDFAEKLVKASAPAIKTTKVEVPLPAAPAAK